jgi:hypothetical protein
MANEQNLIPIKTLSKEEAKKRGSNGGKKSGKVRREKKRLSDYYRTELLEKVFKVKINEEELHKTGGELICDTLLKVMKRGDSASISAIKEIREATEGSKVHNTGSQTITIANAEQVKKIISKLDV